MAKKLTVEVELPDDIVDAIESLCEVNKTAIAEYFADCIVSWTLIGAERQAEEIPPLVNLITDFEGETMQMDPGTDGYTLPDGHAIAPGFGASS
jgi:hypothetical protein